LGARSPHSGHDDRIPIAAELLAAHFGGDNEVREEVTSLIPADGWPPERVYAPLVALGDGWAGSAELRQWVERLRGTSVPWDVWFALYSPTLNPAAELLDALEMYVQKAALVDGGTKRRVHRLCARHLAIDDEGFQLLVHRYLRVVNDPLRASTPGLLVSARGIGVLGRHLLVSDLERELSRNTEPTTGYDLRSDQHCSRAIALLDVLAGGFD
jgi:hypothetical protein